MCYCIPILLQPMTVIIYSRTWTCLFSEPKDGKCHSISLAEISSNTKKNFFLIHAIGISVYFHKKALLQMLQREVSLDLFKCYNTIKIYYEQVREWVQMLWWLINNLRTIDEGVGSQDSTEMKVWCRDIVLISLTVQLRWVFFNIVETSLRRLYLELGTYFSRNL